MTYTACVVTPRVVDVETVPDRLFLSGTADSLPAMSSVVTVGLVAQAVVSGLNDPSATRQS